MISPERFARLATSLVVRRPVLWRFLRPRVRRLFEALAPEWEARRRPDALAALEAALARVEEAPERALDLGTGTGAAAFAIARRWPQAEVVGVDLADGMVAEARRNTPPELAGRVSFAPADASSLSFPDASFELVVLANMIPFFDELARVLAPDGAAVFAFSRGAETPIWVPPARLRAELSRRGFGRFDEVSAGMGTALVARRARTE